MPFEQVEGRTERWFVLKVAPQHELSAEQRLAGKGLRCSVPAYRARRRWSDRVKTVRLPLFPGYVFCRFAMAQRAEALGTPGVRGAITFGSKLAHLEDEEVARIEELAHSGLNLEPLAGLRAGARVRIVDGPLRGMEGALGAVHGSARVIVNVELLNRAVAVEIEPESIEAVGQRALRISA